MKIREREEVPCYDHFSMHNYVTLFTTPELRDMIIGTVILALGASAIATVLGTLGAIGAFYSKKRTNILISTVNQIPVINADVVTGFSICILLVVVLGIDKDTFVPLVAGQVTLLAPFVYLSVIPKLKQMDPSIYEAALDLGATPRTASYFRRSPPACSPASRWRSHCLWTITLSRRTRNLRPLTRSVLTS